MMSATCMAKERGEKSTDIYVFGLANGSSPCTVKRLTKERAGAREYVGSNASETHTLSHQCSVKLSDNNNTNNFSLLS